MIQITNADYKCTNCGQTWKMNVTTSSEIYCPNCGKSNASLSERINLDELLKKYKVPRYSYDKDNTGSISIPDSCKYCSNYPSNGGSGVCYCVLGQQTFT